MSESKPFIRSDLDPVLLANVGLGGEPSEDAKAGKAGDPIAAIRHARASISDEFLIHLRKKVGESNPVVVGVVSIEASGHNQLPLAAAAYISRRLGLELSTDIVQTNSPKRTSMEGLDRIFNAPVFGGTVEPGRQYLILDDTLTQGATFAALASHIRKQGGEICAAVAINGKGYSTQIRPDPEFIQKLRDKYGDLETHFANATGYGYEHLTQSEARYLCNHNKPELVRDRILAAGGPDQRTAHAAVDGRAGHCPDDQGVSGLARRMTSILLADGLPGKRSTPSPK